MSKRAFVASPPSPLLLVVLSTAVFCVGCRSSTCMDGHGIEHGCDEPDAGHDARVEEPPYYLEHPGADQDVEAPPPDPCQVLEEAGWTWVRIADDKANVGIQKESCHEAGPGSDIDAIGIERDGHIFSWAADLSYMPWQDASCRSDNDDWERALGPQNGGVTGGVHFGSFSLNGGALMVAFRNNLSLRCGDIVYVVELDDGTPGDQDYYSVDAGTSDSGPWTPLAQHQTGTVSVEVNLGW